MAMLVADANKNYTEIEQEKNSTVLKNIFNDSQLWKLGEFYIETNKRINEQALRYIHLISLESLHGRRRGGGEGERETKHRFE